MLSSEITGVYFLSTFFMMQFNLPEKFKGNLNKVTQGIDVLAVYWNFDFVFMLSTITSLLMLTINLKSRHLKYESLVDKGK